MIFKPNSNYTGNTRAAKAIYGIILMFVLLYGLDSFDHQSSFDIAVKLFLGAVSITMAEVYSEIVGEKISTQSKIPHTKRMEILNDGFAIVSVSITPILLFLLASINILSLDIAFWLSYAYFLSVLFIFNYYAGVASHASKSMALVYAFSASAVGIVVIAIKLAFGH